MISKSVKDNQLHELCVIFCYHKNNDVTLRNLESIKEHNPGVPIVLVSNGGETLPESYNSLDLLRQKWKKYSAHSPFIKLRYLGYLLHLWKSGPPREYFWRNADLPLYLAYDATRKEIKSKRYVFLEWDCYCNVDLSKFYQEVWSADLAARHVIRPEKDGDWAYFRDKERETVHGGARKSLLGVAPLAGILLSDHALLSVCRELKKGVEWRGVFCELRIATLAQELGLDIQELPESKHRYLRGSEPCWDLSEISEEAVWHMVKS